MGSKGHGLWSVIGAFRSVLCVSVFQDPLLVIVIMIDGSGKRNCKDYRAYSHDVTAAILMWKTSFVPINLHRFSPREWIRSIRRLLNLRVHISVKSVVIPVWALTSCSVHKWRKRKDQKVMKQNVLLIVSLRRF